ncbi:putative amidohydrolase [Janthinobacterium sp. CG_23.3]|uniref:hypothetical protein n=1 Tax=Janthinobacterium sp. CG_23.3 TaxID=3349634 RepID=UPI0038D37B03
MKIALVQLDASNDDAWSIDSMEDLLSLSSGADLVVFPEGMPFYQTGKNTVSNEVAIEKLCSVKSVGKPFIAGGYVRYGEHIRNVAYLIYKGTMLASYFKRTKWRGEHFEPGNESEVVKFSWETKACIPLICADAGDNPSPTGTRRMYQALELGADTNTPIVIPSFGAGLMTSYWKVPLTAWARGCGAPVAICGVSGKSNNTYFEDGESKHYGGGGSAVFLPDGTISEQSAKRGIYIVDLKKGTTERRKIEL